MCDKCDILDKRLKIQEAKPSVNPTKWWVGMLGTVLIFIITQIFVYGKVVATIENHIESDPTYKELSKEFMSKDEINPRLQRLEDMLQYLYEKQGGK